MPGRSLCVKCSPLYVLGGRRQPVTGSLKRPPVIGAIIHIAAKRVSSRPASRSDALLNVYQVPCSHYHTHNSWENAGKQPHHQDYSIDCDLF